MEDRRTAPPNGFFIPLPDLIDVVQDIGSQPKNSVSSGVPGFQRGVSFLISLEGRAN